MSDFFIPTNSIPLTTTSNRREISTIPEVVSVPPISAMAAGVTTSTTVNGPSDLSSSIAASTQLSSSSTIPQISTASQFLSIHHLQHDISHRSHHHHNTTYTAPRVSNPLSRFISRRASPTAMPSQSISFAPLQQPQLSPPQPQPQPPPPRQQIRLPPLVALQAPDTSLGIQHSQRLGESVRVALPSISAVLRSAHVEAGGGSRLPPSVIADTTGDGNGLEPGFSSSVEANAETYPNAPSPEDNDTVNATNNSVLSAEGASRSGSGSSSVEAIGGSVSGLSSGGAMSNYAAYQEIIDLVGGASGNNPTPASPPASTLLGKRGREGDADDADPKAKVAEPKGDGWGSQQVEDNCCTICFEEWTNEGEHRLVCLSCGHLFGRKCLWQWLKRVKKCPSCKKKSSPRDIRILYGVPTKLSVSNAGKIEELRKDLATERKAHNQVKSELQLAKRSLRVCRGKITALERRQMENANPSSLQGWPRIQLVASIHTQGNSKTFEFGVGGTFVYAEKSGVNPHVHSLAHSHVLQPQLASRPQNQFNGLIVDIKTSHMASSPFYGSSAVVSSDRSLRLIDRNYGLSYLLALHEVPMSVSWFPGSSHEIAVGTQSGHVKVFDARYAGHGEALYNFTTYPGHNSSRVAPGVHSLAMHEATETLIAGTSSCTTSIHLAKQDFQESYVTFSPNQNDVGAGLAISNDLLALSLRSTPRFPAIVQPYASMHFDVSHHANGTAGRLGEPLCAPLHGHQLRRPFVKCTALASGRHGERGAIIATADDARSSNAPGGASLFRGVIWASRSVAIEPTEQTDWRLLRTREVFAHPIVDVRSIRSPQAGRNDNTFLGMLSDRKLNVYKFGINSH